MNLKTKTAAIVLALALAIGTLASCGGNTAAMLTLNAGGKDYVMPYNEFAYIMSMYKTEIVYYETGGEDDAAYWESPYYTGQSYGEFYKELLTENYIKNQLVYEYLFDKFELSLPASADSDIDGSIQGIIDNNYGGSKSKFRSALAKFGVSEKTFRDMLIKQYKYYTVFDYVQNSVKFDADPNDEIYKRILAEYNESYVRVKHILIQLNDMSYGFPMPLYDEEEEAEKVAFVKELYERIMAGEDYDELMNEYSEDPGLEYQPDGYTISPQTNFIEEFKDAAFDMEIGEVRMVETDFGWHIMKKEPLLADDLTNPDSDPYQYAMNTFFYEKYINPVLSEIKIDMKLYAKLTMGKLPTFFDYFELML